MQFIFSFVSIAHTFMLFSFIISILLIAYFRLLFKITCIIRLGFSSFNFYVYLCIITKEKHFWNVGIVSA